MKCIFPNLPISKVMILVFMVAMLITVICTGLLIFPSWITSAWEATANIAEEMSGNIYRQIDSFLQVPEQMIKSNCTVVTNGILDLNNENERDRFFAGVLSSYERGLYSFSYGTENGEYYGARRNAQGDIEIIRNNTGTNGNSWYYAVNEDFSAGALTVQAGSFDPRTRAWYTAAAEHGEAVFSPVYKHFVMDDLTVSYACPVYNGDTLQGVIGTHMLLTDIGAYLQETVAPYNGYAAILEKTSDALIANSMGKLPFAVLEDGTLERYGIAALDMPDMLDAYERYLDKEESGLFYEGKEQNTYVSITEIRRGGLSWVVVTAVPKEYLLSPVVRTIHFTALVGVLMLIFSWLVYSVIIGNLMKPMNKLLQFSDAFSSGDLSQRIPVVRNDELGKISKTFNNVADKIQYLVTHLEETVRARTEELHKANVTLEENREQLRLILDSAAEAIYGIDLEGNCTFCNASCIKTLGYSDQSELLGKNMQLHIHHCRRDGACEPDCKIYDTMRQGQGAHVDDEVFWRADGTPFDVEYYSYPQIKNGEIIGAVITFTDITDKKQREAEIQYLNCHDPLTGLHNRRCFEENSAKVDIKENLPLSVIFADINGLKMTNDIFGHTAGDELIKKSSLILRQSCRDSDIIARVGGDEFIILLPKTSKEDAEEILHKIRYGFLNARVEAIKCSISLGLDCKSSPEQLLDEVVANAENAMYKDKSLNRKSNNKRIIDTVIETLHARSPREKEHSLAVGALCSRMGEALHLIENEVNVLSRAGYLHDIGKIVLDESILKKEEALSEEELEKMRQHTAVGYRILNLFDDTLDLAEYVYGHHERWDGAGYPRGLQGAQIPLISRIIAVVEVYDRVRNNKELPEDVRKAAAVRAVRAGAGTRFDPHIAKIFADMIEKETEDNKE